MTLDLPAATSTFAQSVQNLLDSVLPTEAADKSEDRQLKLWAVGSRYGIHTGTDGKVGKIRLFHQHEHVGYLGVEYQCATDRAGEYLAVRKSTFQLWSAKDSTPLVRLDFLHDAHSVPAAHWNVHGERGAASAMLARCNPSHTGFLARIHLPVGGVRYRPCLEDFLELIIIEFNIDRLPGWQEHLQDGRQDWRTYQTKSAVRDLPEAAAEVLATMGYAVTPPQDQHQPNLDMLRCR